MAQYTHSNINTQCFTDNKASGGSGGTGFTFVKEQTGAVMKKIEAWQEEWRIKGVKVWMTDGSSHLAGRTIGRHFLFKLGSDEIITKLNIQPSGKTTNHGTFRLGAISIQTNKGRNWGVYSDGLKDDTQYWVDVGSGLCCGIFGQSGHEVDRLGLAMLRVNSAVLKDVKYPNLDSHVVATKPAFFVTEKYDNSEGATAQSCTLKMTKAITLVKTWTPSSPLDFSQSIEVKAGIPLVSDVEGTFQWTIAKGDSHQMSATETKKVDYEWPVIVPAGAIVKAEAQVYLDQLTTDFTSTMNLKLGNGKIRSYPVKGKYEGANYTRVELKLVQY